MEALFGDTLLTKTGVVPTAEALKGIETVGIYFSAHWCPPCRGFTPVLAEKWGAIRSEAHGSKPFTIVFVSSDHDVDGFNEYYGEQPWLALPYDDRDRKAALSKKYKVRGIPSLVMVDAKTGETITTDGRSAVSDLDAYPWVPPTPPTLRELLPDSFIGREGGAEAVKTDDLFARGAYLGLYFSAHWCGPCRGFTPTLTTAYKAVKAAGIDHTIGFVSSDKDQASFDEYYGDMPWNALEYSDRKRKENLSAHFSVQGIPTFVMLKLEPDGSVAIINDDAGGEVRGDAAGEKFPWMPPLVKDLDDADQSIEEGPAVIALMEGAGGVWDETEALFNTTAEAAKAGGAGLSFWVAKEQGGPSSQIRKMTKQGMPKVDKVNLIILDCENAGYYGGDEAKAAVTKADLDELISAFKAGTLTRKDFAARSSEMN